MDQIAALREGSLDDEIAKAKRQIAAAQFRPLTSASGRASDLASNWHEARNLNFTRDYLRAIEAVDEQRVRELAESLDPSRLIHTQIHPEGLKSSGSRAHAKNQLSEVDVRMLPNGLPVAFLVDRRVPMLHAQWAGKAGLCSENRENNGLNQLLAAVLPKGSVKRDAQEIASMLESLGASMAASSGNNAMLLHAGGLADDSATIIDAMCDVMLAPRLANEVIAHEKSCQLASIEEAMNEPVHAAFSGLRRTAFCGEGYGLDALGKPESLARLDRNALSEHHARHFTVSDSAFAIVGDIDPEMLFDQLSALLAEMPMGESWQPPKSSRGSGDLEIKLPKRQAVLAIGFHGPSVHCPDRYAMSMIQSYLSDMAGPLFTRIREDLGLAYQIGATQFQGYHDGLFTLYLATAPEQLELARHEMMREISRLCSSGIPSEAMERVRASIISGLALQQQSLGNCARQIALDMVLGNPPDQFRRMTGIYQAIRAEEVQDAATRYFSQSPVTCTVLPAKSDG
jgi:zinc protease